MFVSVLPIFAFGFASLINSIRKNIPKLMGVLLLCLIILWNFGLIIQYATGMVPRQSEVSLKTLVQNQFTRVPQITASMFAGFILKRASIEEDLTQ
jgi:hypothetical protein